MGFVKTFATKALSRKGRLEISESSCLHAFVAIVTLAYLKEFMLLVD
jgi:hypothetical protein